MEDFADEGWLSDPTYATPLFEDIHPGFSTPLDHYSTDALDSVPVYAEFMKPRGLIAAAGTIVQGSSHQAIQISFEGFRSHDAARSAVRTLDALRPHLARALSLAERLRLEKANAIVDAFERSDVAAAIVGTDGRMHGHGALFETRLRDCASISRSRLRFRDTTADRLFVATLATDPAERATGKSFVARRGSLDEAVAIHMLPLAGQANSLFGVRGFLLLAVSAANRAIPGADLLRLMFDLTPAEARLTRRLVEGQSLSVAAAGLNIRESTARVHLRAVFAKTGVSRQRSCWARSAAW